MVLGRVIFATCNSSALIDLLQVNSRRLADGELRPLYDKDVVSFSALPMSDDRLDANPKVRLFVGSTLNHRNALQFMYCVHTIETLADKLSTTGHVVRRSMDELLRIRKVVRTVSHSPYVRSDSTQDVLDA